MLFSSKLNSVNGIEEAAVMMGTNHNVDLMINSGLLTKDQASKITSNDLVIGIKGKDKKAIDEAIKVLNEQFENKNTISNDSKSKVVKNIDAAINEVSDLNLAVISVPGRFAKNEAMKCLKKNMHVLLFSDNVSIDEENELKSYAVKNNLLMMGPDCGTAIINGVALGFANVISNGSIGIVAA
jgi:FdrA protein